jgi:hypothetical protein
MQTAGSLFDSRPSGTRIPGAFVLGIQALEGETPAACEGVGI